MEEDSTPGKGVEGVYGDSPRASVYAFIERVRSDEIGEVGLFIWRRMGMGWGEWGKEIRTFIGG